jgi:predicted permease
VPALFRDLRGACRSLVRQPAWTCAAILCLAIGIGPNTAAFSIVNGLILRPLPFPDAHRLVMVAVQERERGQTRPWRWSEYREVAPALEATAELAVRTFAPVALSAGDDSRMVQSELVSANYFEVLRLTPAAGRFLRADADRPGAAGEAVISHALWRQRFGGRPSIVGEAVRVNGHPVTICGVAPPGFVGVMQLVAADLWLPASLGRTIAGASETEPQYGATARLGAETTRARFEATLDVLLARRTGPGESPLASIAIPAAGFGVPPALRGVALGASALLFGLMALVTGIAVANVASLTLARAESRRREMGVRIALGAGAWPLVRRVLAESLVLAGAGAAAGFVLAYWVLRALAALAPDSGQPDHIAYAIDVAPDLRVLAYAVVAALVVALLFGLAPARLAVRTDVVDALKGAAGAGRAPAAARGLRAIVAGQIAVSTLLLVGAGLLTRTYLNTLAVSPGIETRGVSVVSLDLGQTGIDPVEGRRVLDDILARAASLPGVERAALGQDRPLSFSGRNAAISVDDEAGGAGMKREAGSLIVTPEYFDLLGIDLVGGRGFAAADTPQPALAVVNETMARRFWPGASPLGRRFRVGAAGKSIEVIGVVRDVTYRSLTEAPRAVFYRSWNQAYTPAMSVIVRARSGSVIDPRAVVREVRAVRSDLAPVDVSTLDQRLQAMLAPRRQSALFLFAICAAGLVLSSVGLFGVMAHSVRRRTRELGIRMALGASSRDVVRMVLTQGLRLMLTGLAIGVALSTVATRAIAGMLYGVSTHDPVSLAGAAAVLLIVTLVALYLPARWATRVAPTVALRED